MNSYFFPAKICLPKKASMEKWSVIACDQYTSDEDYWNKTNEIVGTSPSTLRMIFPEIDLNKEDHQQRIEKINQTMQSYLSMGLLDEMDAGYVYIRRTLSDTTIRRGLLGLIDLEMYDFHKDAKTPIRATEGTVLSRIPPRVAIRENAPLELPHVMLLFNDATDDLFDTLERGVDQMNSLYAFNLMQNGGHIDGHFLTEEQKQVVDRSIAELAGGENPLVFAVGDGNHSLATAKQCYENLKTTLSAAQAASHPARYALVELVNIHDKALAFEPIYRVLFHVDQSVLLDEMKRYFPTSTVSKDKPKEDGSHIFEIVCGEKQTWFTIQNPTAELPVGTIQPFLDAYLKAHPKTEIDYIHGIDETKRLAAEPNTVGILFRGMEKKDLFTAVKKDGSLPKKTFSMGNADSKRFYLECRKIK